MTDEPRIEQRRRPITQERAIDLHAYGVRTSAHLATSPDPLTLSEALVVLATAVGISISGIPDGDRRRLLAMLSALALKVAADAEKMVNQ